MEFLLHTDPPILEKADCRGDRGVRRRVDADKKRRQIDPIKELLKRQTKITEALRVSHRRSNARENSNCTPDYKSYSCRRMLNRELETIRSRLFNAIKNLESRDTRTLLQKIREFSNITDNDPQKCVKTALAESERFMEVFYPDCAVRDYLTGEIDPSYFVDDDDYDPELGPYYDQMSEPTNYDYYHWEKFLALKKTLVEDINTLYQEIKNEGNSQLTKIMEDFDYAETVSECSGNQIVLNRLIGLIDQAKNRIELAISEGLETIEQTLLSKPTYRLRCKYEDLKRYEERYKHSLSNTDKRLLEELHEIFAPQRIHSPPRLRDCDALV